MDIQDQYEDATRDYYKDSEVAKDYFQRLSFRVSPTDWVLTELEILLVRRAFRALTQPERRLL